MVWMTKREIAYYLVLRHVFGDKIFNLGEALDVLQPLGSKRTARKIIKRLVSRGLLEKAGELTYRVKDLEPALLRNLRSYLVQRIHRRLKSLGFNTVIVVDSGVEKILIEGCNNVLKVVVEELKRVIEIECISDTTVMQLNKK